jgi:hypothetical protein
MQAEPGFQAGDTWDSSEWLQPDGSTRIIKQPILVLGPAMREDYEAEYPPNLRFPDEPNACYYFVSSD